jgi:hypothetical protein
MVVLLVGSYNMSDILLVGFFRDYLPHQNDHSDDKCGNCVAFIRYYSEETLFFIGICEPKVPLAFLRSIAYITEVRPALLIVTLSC